jgi:amino acid transporter
VIAAFVAVVMMFSLVEMAVVHPSAGSLGTYAEIYLNPWAGFIVRYSYWMCQVIAVGAEAVAAGFLAAFVVATEEGEVQAQGVEIEGLGELWRVVELDVEFEVEVGWVWVAWVGWGAVGFESDVFVGVAGCGAVGGSEFFY